MRIRRRKNLISRMETVSSLLWPESGYGALPEELQGRPLNVEIGCGMGGFITQMALRHPEELFLAVEREQNVAIRAMEKTYGMGLENTRFCLCDAAELERRLPPGRVRGLFLNFSDPWPHRKHEHRRLTSGRHLDLYRVLLEPNGQLTLKTDNAGLYRFTETELRGRSWRILSQDEDWPDGDDNIRTEYETRFRAEAKPIYRITAQPPLAKEA